MAKFWVDPDEGWKFGFPKLWDEDKHPDQRKWLEENGWPKDHKIHYIRSWVAEREDDDREL